MTAYLNEDEQVEAIKKWWKENGRSLVIGVVLGLAAIFGWKGWQSYRIAQGEAASNLYITMQNQAAAGNVENALATGKRLLGEHTASVYASFAALRLARISYARGDRAEAAENLNWVVEHAPDDVVADLARVRLARVRVDLDEVDAAAKVLEQVGADFMPGTVAELRGDIARAKGDLAAAREAYVLALASEGGARGLVKMKLQEIGLPEKSS